VVTTKGDIVVTPLRQRILEDLQIRNYAPTTIRIYLHVMAELARHFGKPRDQLGAEHVRCYQPFLVKEKGVSQSTYIQTVCALPFFYTHSAGKSPSTVFHFRAAKENCR